MQLMGLRSISGKESVKDLQSLYVIQIGRGRPPPPGKSNDITQRFGTVKDVIEIKLEKMMSSLLPGDSGCALHLIWVADRPNLDKKNVYSEGERAYISQQRQKCVC